MLVGRFRGIGFSEGVAGIEERKAEWDSPMPRRCLRSTTVAVKGLKGGRTSKVNSSQTQ